jgi:endo-1,4-beta-xylanase
MRVRSLLMTLLLAGLVTAARAEEIWEELDDGSLGRETEFEGAGGIMIPAYVRKPAGPGPFPAVMLLHGGGASQAATVGLGRSLKAPTADFLKAGWAVYSIDYRPKPRFMLDPVEIDDCVAAFQTLRKLPFVDPNRIGLLGGSHGANLGSRLASRVDVCSVILCAPAALDLIEVKKAVGRSEPVVGILKKLIAEMEKRHGAAAEEIEKEPAKYDYRSALTETAQVRCPILIINGRNDDNSPTSVIDAYVQRLRTAGKPVETYLPDNGPHGFYFGRPAIPEYAESTRRAVAFLQQRFAEEPKKPAAKRNAPLAWVDPDKSSTALTQYATFFSKTINTDVSYQVYLPPGYEQQTNTRYPVLYFLHGSGGSQHGSTPFARRFDQAIRAGRLDPLIIVGVNGLRGETMYCDARDGKFPLETVITKDLIPHIDTTYRTIASRTGRAIEGFSMGGFGAAHFGFKYPEVFGVVSIMAPALLGPELKQPLPSRAWGRLFQSALGGDLEYFKENDPFALVPKNADALRDRSVIRIVIHVENENWLAPRCDELHELLMKHTIAHQFLYLANVKSHNQAQVLDTLGTAGLAFFEAGFKYLQKPDSGK